MHSCLSLLSSLKVRAPTTTYVNFRNNRRRDLPPVSPFSPAASAAYLASDFLSAGTGPGCAATGRIVSHIAGRSNFEGSVLGCIRISELESDGRTVRKRETSDWCSGSSTGRRDLSVRAVQILKVRSLYVKEQITSENLFARSANSSATGSLQRESYVCFNG